MPQDPCVRTASPQPVSSTRRRLSTDEMQLREVGKLAVHLWKIRWLQKPSQQALLRELCGTHWTISLWDGPRAVLWGSFAFARASFRTGATPSGPRGRARADLLSIQWLMWNCCCAGESDCLIETQLCEGTSWLVP